MLDRGRRGLRAGAFHPWREGSKRHADDQTAGATAIHADLLVAIVARICERGAPQRDRCGAPSTTPLAHEASSRGRSPEPPPGLRPRRRPSAQISPPIPSGMWITSSSIRTVFLAPKSASSTVFPSFVTLIDAAACFDV